MFLSSYRNTCESLGELEKAVSGNTCLFNLLQLGQEISVNVKANQTQEKQHVIEISQSTQSVASAL